MRFLQAAEALFFKGWQLGSDPEIQVATAVNNHLTAGIIKYFTDSYRLDRAANLFEKVMAREPEIAALLARSYIGMSEWMYDVSLTADEEIKAVKIMNAALEENPQSYPILHAQCDFLMSKGKHQWAQAVAQQAVNSAPSEFVTWAKLTETYIELGQFDSALLTLNSCPMFTFNERDLHRMPTPAKTHLPVKKFIADSNILDEESARDNEVRVRVGTGRRREADLRPTLRCCAYRRRVCAGHSPKRTRYLRCWCRRSDGTTCSRRGQSYSSWRRSTACTRRRSR